MLIDETDPGETPRVLVYLQHAVVDGRMVAAGARRVVSKRFEFVNVDPSGIASTAGWAPYLDYRAADPEELELLAPVIERGWVRDDLEQRALDHGVELARAHLDEVRRRTVDRVDRTTAAVKERLESEIRHWDHRANQLKDRELAGKLPASGMNSGRARQRADELEARLKHRLEELDAERQLASSPPVVAGGALIVPAGLLASLRGRVSDEAPLHAQERSATERAAADAVMDAERDLGRQPVEMPPNNKGYDIESKDADGHSVVYRGQGPGRRGRDVHHHQKRSRCRPQQARSAHPGARRGGRSGRSRRPLRPPGLRRGWRAPLQHHQRQPAVESLPGTRREAGMTTKKKLIEVALPLDAINREAAREKSIRAGHPSTLHLWWARRPLAACRAVLFASLVDDPSARPDLFPTEEEQDQERDRLFTLIERLVPWENSNNRDVLDAAWSEIERSCAGRVPPVIDPFSGGGSIPLETQRLGLRVDASDLNPVAVLITKALVELPPRFSGRKPVHPELQGNVHIRSWDGAQGLAEDVRAYACWMNDEAKSRIGKLYPDVAIPGGRSGERATVMTWLWARTVTCPNPACKSTMPLLNSFAVCRKRGREAWLRAQPDRESRSVTFSVEHGPGCPAGGTVNRRGATCLVCQATIPLAEVRKVAKAGDLGAQLLCTVAEGERSRVYLDADDEQVQPAKVDMPTWKPESEIPLISGIFNAPIYGIDRHWKLFTNRQLQTMTTFADLVAEARQRVLGDGGEREYADAIATYLTLGIGRLANRCSSQCFWDPGGEGVMQVFARQALPMVWAYAEANPFSSSSGNFLGQIDYLVEALSRVPGRGEAVVRQLDAAASTEHTAGLVCTDPPYYNNIPYADLSDFFYVWFRHCLRQIYPDLFSTLLVPKNQELIADPTRFGGSKSLAAEFFESGLRHSFANMLALQDERFPMTVFYAFKQEEVADEDGGGHVSTGWETMLQGLLDSGATITGTWPVRTEQPGGLREVGRAALASSIVLVCRRRPVDAPLATRKEFLSALKAELPSALLQLQHGNIAPVDLAQASIGPGMAIFSRYARVVEADGRAMRVRSALTLINQVLDEILTAQEGDFDTETRWALAWFEEQGLEVGPFGKAETLSKAKNTAVNALVLAGIVESSGNRVRLLGRDESQSAWDPATEDRLTVWEVTQHLIHTLLSGGEEAAAALLRRVGGLGETARELAYRLYVLCDRKKWATEALAYNALVVAWPEISRLAGAPPSGAASGRLFESTEGAD